MVTSRADVVSARCGGIDLLKEELVVPENGDMPPIEVVLRDNYATAKINVHSDVRALDGWIVMVPQRNDPVVINISTDSDLPLTGSRRRIHGICPGFTRRNRPVQ